MKATSKGLTACLIAVCCLTGCSQSAEIVGSTPAPDGRYHATQEEIDHAEALNAAIHDINVNGPTYDGSSKIDTTAGASQEEIDALDALLGI